MTADGHVPGRPRRPAAQSEGRGARRRPRPVRLPVRAAPGHPAAHRDRDGRRRRRLSPACSAATSACCRRATCAWRWPRCAATTPGAPPGAGWCSTGSSGRGGLGGHAVGNVLIVALWELLGDTVQGLDWVGRLLGAHGRVLPMASVPLDLVAEVEGADPARPGEITLVRGQVACASTTGRVRSVSLDPRGPARLPAGHCRGRHRGLGRVSAPVPGSPASCPTCWCPSWQKH